MSTIYEPVVKAPVIYVTSTGEFKKLNVVAINGVSIPNSFDIPYVRGVVGLFNVILSRFMYFSEYGANKQKRRYPQAQEYIYLPAHQISDMINRCESQSYNLIRSMERIFDIQVTRAHEKAGSNKFWLSERVYEFLHIFTYAKLNAFIEKYNISSEDQYALRQLYNYRVVRPSDANMNREVREEYHSFIKARKHRNFLNYCATNNMSVEARVHKIELHIDLLSPKQREQLQRIKQYIAEGIKKLANYFHWKLQDLQQYITLMLKKDQIKAPESNREEDSTHSQVIDRNKTEKEIQKTHEVGSTHLKDPEDVTFQEIVQVATYWNIMARGRDMEFMNTLSDKKIQSIYTLVKYHGKDKVITTIENTGNMILNTTLMFKDFTRNSNDPNSRFNKIHRREKRDTRFTEAEEMTIRNKKYKFYLKQYDVCIDNIPEFNSKADAKSWFKSMLNQM